MPAKAGIHKTSAGGENLMSKALYIYILASKRNGTLYMESGLKNKTN